MKSRVAQFSPASPARAPREAVAAAPTSRLYECHVMHARFAPTPHRFVYRIFMMAIDLDELPALHRRLKLFSVNRANLYAFRERDYLPITEPLHNPSPANPSAFSQSIASSPTSPASSVRAADKPSTPSLKARILAYLSSHGIDLGENARIELVTLPRVFGYLFNPVSFYFCRDASGECVATIAEVTNTFREMKPYLLGPGTRVPPAATTNGLAAPDHPGASDSTHSAPPAFRLRTSKHFYVSPFSDVDVEFDFHLRMPGEKLSIQIDDHVGGQRTLTSTLTGPARPLTDARLAWFTLKYPLITLKVITLIHWHAFKLYVRKTPWFRKADRASDQRDLYRPHASVSSRKS